ncbi:uncharacterized protein CELE_Y45F10D.14 [Caenorhabditis elegans]|uniref:Uncharacterized protein n=1 Tax=Caenorhabditis elegans TaxID=6239 RepID=Q7YWQ7_CAEEL|nr:Uncharacterized protein CELE_Y45F10D.14 [Caenorhabditis elegans]CAE17999.1 Uncharacterized protein CELE_Y45F10D.14 [Caenorhabditis elegans]|eukprot:NP_001023471.1 Uncharacterized protein CELE_Y45F10D.14 [Caenorhabditis elegans]
MSVKLWIWWSIFGFWISSCTGFLWTLFGGNHCNCCRCPAAPRPPQYQQHFLTAPTLIPHYQSSYAISYSPPSPPSYPISNQDSYVQPPGYTVPQLPTTPKYPGPPSAAPVHRDQLYTEERKYSTNQVAYHSESRRVTIDEYGGQALDQLEDELAAEKYKYNKQKIREKEEKERKEKQKQGRIRVFKIKPHKSPKVSNGMVEWQSSQVAKYTNEKAVQKFIEATSESNDLNENESLEEFIPIEIGNEPEFADEEPAGPPPNVRNRLSHDPVLVNNIKRRRFIY